MLDTKGHADGSQYSKTGEHKKEGHPSGQPPYIPLDTSRTPIRLDLPTGAGTVSHDYQIASLPDL